MTQRLIAASVAGPLVLALLVVAWLTPLPYVTYQPGPTLNVLGDYEGDQIITATGHDTYPDEGGELRMTTVSVSRSDSSLNLYSLMAAWLSDADAVYPRESVYPDGETQEESETEGQVQMVSSQDTAIAVAMTELGYDVEPAVEVLAITPGSPADGQLKVRDVLQTVDGTPIDSTQTLVDAIQGAATGDAVRLGILRGGEERTVSVTPEAGDDGPQIGIQLGGGFVFPFEVTVGIDPSIGGPSAGLMFSLGIYDVLTPGSLTGDGEVAGTGTISADGSVGPIGGIQQKIVGAREAGADLFLVPKDNCDDAVGAANGDMRLAEVDTMHDAVEAIEAWAADPDADLPTCGSDS